MPTRHPFVSVITPTLNSQRTLKLCLESVVMQKYRGKVEIIVADGGSLDDTIKTARRYKADVVKNLLKTGEAGKAVGAKYAKGEILAFIDSDNVLPDKNWLERMISPFVQDSEILASEPLYFTYRKKDHWLTRYFALIGMGDPLSLFIGNYDRYSFVTDKWTELRIPVAEAKGYLILSLSDEIPTIGANGFLIRKSALKKYPVKDYLFDVDVIKFLAKRAPIKVAKVKVGIVHLFAGNVSTFIRKQKRRIRDYFYFQKSGLRVGPDTQKLNTGKRKFTIACLTIVPLLMQAIAGYTRKRDFIWLFHPLACWITFFVYSIESLRQPFTHGQLNRERWSQ